MSPPAVQTPGIEIRGANTPRASIILNPAALDFVAFLERGFRQRRAEVLAQRSARQAAFRNGTPPDFSPETAYIRADATWRVPALPRDLRDRPVEVVVPPVREALAEAMRSGAPGVMADFEDGCAPTWSNLVEGQANLFEAIRRGGDGQPEAHPALVVRPRGWHLDEPRLRIDGQPAAGAIFDVGLYLFHNAQVLVERGSGPYVCLAKIESRFEARLWNDILLLGEERLSLPRGTIRAVCMIETLAASFEMDEILYELRDHAAGLVAGPRDYALSTLRTPWPNGAMPSAVDAGAGPDPSGMRACQALLVATCRRRGAFALGGATDGIPIGSDPAASQAVSDRVRRHARDDALKGFDGTRVMHPGMAAVARASFEHGLAARPSGADALGFTVSARELLACDGAYRVSAADLRAAISLAIQYTGAWLGGAGSIAVRNRVTDTAAADFCRARLRRWIEDRRHLLGDEREISLEQVLALVPEVLTDLRAELGEPEWRSGRYEEAARLFEVLCCEDPYAAHFPMRGAALLD